MNKVIGLLLSVLLACGALDASAQQNPAPAQWQGPRTATHGVCYQNTGQGVTLQDASVGQCSYPAGINLNANIVKAGGPAPGSGQILPTAIYQYLYPSGTCAAATGPGGCALNYFYTNETTGGVNAGPPANLVQQFNIGYLYGGPNVLGNRIAMDISTNLAAPTGNGISGYGSVGLRVSSYMKSGDNGTDTVNNSSGNISTTNFVAELLNGATNIRGMQVAELDWGADAGSSVLDKFGMQITELFNDAVMGARSTIALVLTSQGNVGTGAVPGIANGITFGNPAGFQPVNSTGTLISCFPHVGASTCSGVADGVDLSKFVGFSDAAFKSPGFAVDGSGNISMASTLTAGASPLTIKITAVSTSPVSVFLGDPTVRNAVQFTLAQSAQPSVIKEAGIDTNRDLWIQAAGTGSLWLGNTNVGAGAGGGVRITDTGAGPAVNILSIGPSAAGGARVTETCGGPISDTVVDCFLVSKGAASFFRFLTNTSDVALDVIDTAGGAASTNHLVIQAGVSGSPTILSIGGGDANADIQLKALGPNGTLQFGSGGFFAANGTVATSLGSLGPAGANTLPRAWVVFKNSAGNPYYLPAF